MSYLIVTTSRSLLLVETESGACYCLDTGRDHYYGITRDLGRFYVGARYRANTSLVPKDQEVGKILRFDATGKFIDEIAPSFPMRDIHQILIFDGRLWVTCTYDNMIAIFDGLSWDAWYPLGKSYDEPYDLNHFNSLAAFGNTLCVVAHNLGAQSGKLSELFFYRVSNLTLDRGMKLGVCAHNAWVHQGEIMTCSSAEGCLVGEFGSKIFTGGFPRGVAYSSDEIYIGISEFASRPDRDLGKGWIKVFDCEWNMLRTLEIYGEGMVTDICFVSEHNARKILAASKNKVDCISVLSS